MNTSRNSPESPMQRNTAELESYGCNASCQAILSVSNPADLETVGTEFDFDFYSTPNNFSYSAPGDLLKLQPVDSSDLNIPAGIATFRFQYTSIDLDGTNVPSSGFIAFPFASPANGSQFRLITYARGTIGVHRGCAPSSSPSLFNYNSWAQLMYSGYAVVATDYAGLGNNYTLHKYSAFTAHANDIYYSVQAARKAFPGMFTKEWASIGHSRGGGAVWKLSEHPLVQKHSSGYLGAVAASPASKLYDMSVETFERMTPRPDFHQFAATAELG
ncbi:putative prolyl aminopeptidase (secreted protein) protein [Botrytis fragariae]|uniref:Putative prolyl aminopeptidase (Secreted protein) protein n=1 Tax=Botrytis fragariae TaxID=1964551 RepID=A0A8H6AVS0_9HELO|nr:putative prolyl aminopeptidase (secreted protein) protein [Botrytis fragariae]KAF5874673.1 putative prolyl aminopeptidase (secreted protein) protein [Botrytis fragariae]